MSLDFYVPRYDAGVVALSIGVAMFASYVALDLARRIHEQDRRGAALAWTVGGALVMGSGIWSMHFIGMLAMQLPIDIGYNTGPTLLSWVAAVAVSAFALSLGARPRLSPSAIGFGALIMGGGICAMHYLGMGAIDLAPGIVWNPVWVAASALIAFGASAAALLILQGMRRFKGLRARAAQAAAAVVMGLAISGMHYTGMVAAGFPDGAICLSDTALGGRSLGLMTVLAVVVLLSIALLTAALDARLQARATHLAQSLSQANAELQRQVFIDGLTGLYNRTLFDGRLQQSVARVRRLNDMPHGKPNAVTHARLALLFIDLDGFKPVNDSFGHAAGDTVLRQVADRLRMVVRSADTLARLGGDEFVLLIDDVSGVPDAVVTAQRVLRKLSVAFDVQGRQVSLSASIGVVVFPDQCADDKLLAAADAAMYAAKRAGGSTYAVFEPHMHKGAEAQLELQQALREAVKRGELRLHYQPKVDCRSGQVHSVEALLRWEHPKFGLIGPATFVPLAERFGLIQSIGAWVIDEACRQMAEWGTAGSRMRVSVNLSAYQLRQPDIAARIGAALAQHQIAPSQLVCEVTESAAMEDTQVTTRVLNELGALGVKLSIDDFGTGYSSLAKLRQMRAHELKIDREFVADVATDDDARAVVHAIVRLAHALGLRVVAEGVETAEQRDTLRELGCDELQGYYFARPVPAQALPASARATAEQATPRIEFSDSVILEDPA
jgi:diguanylate cyclase